MRLNECLGRGHFRNRKWKGSSMWHESARCLGRPISHFVCLEYREYVRVCSSWSWVSGLLIILYFILWVVESNRFLSTQWAISFLFMALTRFPKLIISKSLPAVLIFFLSIIIVFETAHLLLSCCYSNKSSSKELTLLF